MSNVTQIFCKSGIYTILQRWHFLPTELLPACACVSKPLTEDSAQKQLHRLRNKHRRRIKGIWSQQYLTQPAASPPE